VAWGAGGILAWAGAAARGVKEKEREKVSPDPVEAILNASFAVFPEVEQ